MSTAIALHLLAAALALAGVLAVLALPKGRGAHRAWGWLAAGGMMAAALTSFGIPRLGALSWIHALSVLTLVNLPLAVRAARAGRMREHRRRMLGSAGALLVAGAFAVAAPGRLLHAWLPG
ncbi:hypothetical protein ACI6QG_10600 [Roseococcus sp. DSY-14]|uniref:hypothetical protein n=1 Tax=Roseococcus sp. DSY-14 TaxID=3369650 RepID=UPI00387B1442